MPQILMDDIKVIKFNGNKGVIMKEIYTRRVLRGRRDSGGDALNANKENKIRHLAHPKYTKETS